MDGAFRPLVVSRLAIALCSLALCVAGAAAQELPLVAAPAAAASPAADPSGEVVEIRAWFVAIDPLLDRAALPGRPTTVGQAGASAPTVTYHARADFAVRSGESVLRFDGPLLTSAPADPALRTPWTILSAPRLLCVVGQAAEVSIRRTVPFMERGEGDCFVLREEPQLVEGYSLNLTPNTATSAGVQCQKTRIACTRLIGRQPVDGVPFEVGRPQLGTIELQLDLLLEPGKVALVRLPGGEGEPAVIVLLSADPAAPRR